MIVPNINIVEFCLTYRCNIKCNNCSNLCTQAPFHGDLSIDDVARFIHESVEYKWPWKIITIHGGEPALHPQFQQICGMLANYRDRFNRECRIWCLSNVSTDGIRERLKFINHEYKIGIGDSPKIGSNVAPSGAPILYVPVNRSPVDAGEEPTDGCFQTTDCGICFNYLGFWECSPAGAAARVFGYEPMARHIWELDPVRLASGFSLHCRHCGFASTKAKRVFEQLTTETWKEKLDEYARTHDDCRTE